MKKIYKHLRSIFFRFHYKLINKTSSVKKIISLKVIKVSFNKKIFYNLYFIKQGRIFSDTVNNTSYIYKDILLKEPSYQFRFNHKKRVVNGKISSNPILKYGITNFERKLKGKIFSLLSGGAAKNYYWHWMFDTLPKIGILEKVYNLKNINFFLLPSLKKKYQIDTLVNLNIPNNKLIDVNYYKHIKADDVIATDHPVVFKNNPSESILDIPDWIIKWLRKKYLYNLNKRKYYKYKKIYIIRKNNLNSNNRKILNDEEVQFFLTKKGYKIIDLESLPFIDQVKLFSSAESIIGIHGSSLTNVVFSKPKTKIIEIQSFDTGDANKNLSIKNKLIYCRIQENNLNDKLDHQNFHIKVNVEKLNKLIS